MVTTCDLNAGALSYAYVSERGKCALSQTGQASKLQERAAGSPVRRFGKAAVTAGLRLGFTVTPQRPQLPLNNHSRMTLGRFLFHGGQDIRRQCRLFGARFVPSNTLRTLMQPGY